MSYSRTSKQLKELQLRAAELQQQYRELAAGKRALHIRNGLLSAMCDALCFIQIKLACTYSSSQVEQEGGAAQSGELLETEVKLLQQLFTKTEPGDSHLLAQLLQPEAGTIAPCTDPMQYLQRVVSLPPFEGAATMKAEDVACVMQESIERASIKLHQVCACMDPVSMHTVMAQLVTTLDRYWHCLLSLVLMGRQDVVEQASCMNLQTKVVEPAEAAHHQQAQATAVVPLLGLSPQQQEFIAVGTQLYYDLLAAIHQERLKINTEMTVADPDQVAVGRTSMDDSSVDAGSSTGVSSGSEQLEMLPDRQKLLERQQELTNRLKLLLNKEYKLRASAMDWFIGTLTYKQLAWLAVMSYSYAKRPLFLATQVMQQWQQLSKCHQQHGL